MRKDKSPAIRLVALVLVLALTLPITVRAATADPIMPFASYYLDSYNTYNYAAGNGMIQVWFSVMGTGNMDEIGVLSIRLYESTDNAVWRHVQTCSHENYPSMLAEDDFYHSSFISYQGVPGRYYKAYVCIWAGKDGSGDTRYMWATSVRAT